MFKKEDEKNFIQIILEKDGQELLEEISTSKSKEELIESCLSFGFNICNKISKKNHEVYQNNVEPKKLRLREIEKELDNKNLKESRKDELILELANVDKEINEIGECYLKSTKNKVFTFLAGAFTGCLATVGAYRIFSGTNKSDEDYDS